MDATARKQLGDLLAKLGCPDGKCDEMAVMLDKRAHQLADEKGRSYEDALKHLIDLMRQGWAAKERGL